MPGEMRVWIYSTREEGHEEKDTLMPSSRRKCSRGNIELLLPGSGATKHWTRIETWYQNPGQP